MSSLVSTYVSWKPYWYHLLCSTERVCVWLSCAKLQAQSLGVYERKEAECLESRGPLALKHCLNIITGLQSCFSLSTHFICFILSTLFKSNVWVWFLFLNVYVKSLCLHHLFDQQYS